jgi:hypothetical protein
MNFKTKKAQTIVNEMSFTFEIDFDNNVKFPTNYHNNNFVIYGYYTNTGEEDLQIRTNFYYAKGSWDTNTSIDLYDFCELNGFNYDDLRDEIIGQIDMSSQTEKEHFLSKRMEKFRSMEKLISETLELIDKSTFDMWADDLEYTHECIVLERVDYEEGMECCVKYGNTESVHGNKIAENLLLLEELVNPKNQ